VSQQSPDSRADAAWYARIGTDWWATIVAGAIVVLAVANLLPKIPW
jgi:hypothetical protein